MEACLTHSTALKSMRHGSKKLVKIFILNICVQRGIPNGQFFEVFVLFWFKSCHKYVNFVTKN